MYCCSSLNGDAMEAAPEESFVLLVGVAVVVAEAGGIALGAFIFPAWVGWRLHRDSLDLSSSETDLLNLVLGRRQSLPVQ